MWSVGQIKVSQWNRIYYIVKTSLFKTVNISFNPLEWTNKKWFNLSKTSISAYVTNLLQLDSNFNLPDSINKENSIKEFIKDIEIAPIEIT